MRSVSHNLIISKSFEEENNEIQNQYFIRNAADELSVISLGFGGFYVAINPCSFAIEYSSETFLDMHDINLKEVVKFEARAATVFRIEGLDKMPIFDFNYIESQLETTEQKEELAKVIESITGINDQYTNEQGALYTNFDSIELNADALNAANYQHLESNEYKAIAIEEEADELEVEIAKRKQELEQINQELASKEQEVKEAIKKDEEVDTISTSNFDDDFSEFAKELDELNEFLEPDDLFAMLTDLDDEE